MLLNICKILNHWFTSDCESRIEILYGNRVLSQQLLRFKVVITKVWEIQYYSAITRAQWVYSMRLNVKGRRKRAAGNSPSDRFLPTNRCRIIQYGYEESFKQLIFSTMNSISRYAYANCLNKCGVIVSMMVLLMKSLELSAIFIKFSNQFDYGFEINSRSMNNHFNHFNKFYAKEGFLY